MPIDWGYTSDGRAIESPGDAAGQAILEELIAQGASQDVLAQQAGFNGIVINEVPTSWDPNLSAMPIPPSNAILDVARQEQGIEIGTVMPLPDAPPPANYPTTVQQPMSTITPFASLPPMMTLANPPGNYWENFTGITPAVAEYGDWELGKIRFVSGGGGGIVGSLSGVRFGTLERIVMGD